MGRRNPEFLQFGRLVIVADRLDSNIIPVTNEGVIVRLYPEIGGVIVLPSFNTKDGVAALGSHDREISASRISAIAGILTEEEILARLKVGINDRSRHEVDVVTMNALVAERRMNFGSRETQIPWSPPWRLSFPRLGRFIRL